MNKKKVGEEQKNTRYKRQNINITPNTFFRIQKCQT